MAKTSIEHSTDYYRHLIDEGVSERAIEQMIGEGWTVFAIYQAELEGGSIQPIDIPTPAVNADKVLAEALRAIADLPTGLTEEVMEGHEDAYRAVERLQSTPAPDKALMPDAAVAKCGWCQDFPDSERCDCPKPTPVEEPEKGAAGAKLTPEYLAMTPLQKWDTLALHGLLGTDEPWIEDMRQTLSAGEQVEAETYELGKQDGYSDAVQWIDERTGGDGEYFASTIPGRGCTGTGACWRTNEWRDGAPRPRATGGLVAKPGTATEADKRKWWPIEPAAQAQFRMRANDDNPTDADLLWGWV